MRPDSVDIDRKRSHCLRNCLIVTLLLIVLLFGAVVGGAFFAYEQFARPILEISLMDAFGILNAFGKAGDLKVTYTEADRTAFYESFEKATYLDLPADFTISNAVNSMLAAEKNPENDKTDGNVDNQQGKSKEALLAGEPVTENPTPDMNPKPEGESDNPLAGLNDFTTNNKYLDDLLKKTEFRFDKLVDYEKNGTDLVITDKQFAAIINEVLQGLDLQQIKDMEANLGIKLKDVLVLEDLKISAPSSKEVALQDGTVGNTTITKKDTKLSLTLCLELEKNLKTIIKKQVPEIPEFAVNMAASLLPKRIHVGLGVYPYDAQKKPDIVINEIKGDIMNNLQTALNGILTKVVKSEKTFDDIMRGVSDTVVKTVNAVESSVGNLTLLDSSLQMDPIALIMTALKVNPKDEETGEISIVVNRHNFFTMLEHLYKADNEIKGLDEGVDYVEQTMGTSYKAVATNEEYKTKVGEFLNSYFVNMEVPEKPKDMIEKFKDVPSNIDLVHATLKGKNIYEYEAEELVNESVIDDATIGYIINDYINDMLNSKPETTPDGTVPSESQGFNLPIGISVSSIEICEEVAKDANGNEVFDANNNKVMLQGMKLVVGITTDKLLEGVDANGVLSNLITSIIPKNLYVKVTLPLDSSDPNYKIKSSIVVNFIDEDKSEEAFETLKNIISAVAGPESELAQSLDINSLMEKIDGYIQQAFDEIDKVFAELENKNKPNSEVSMAGEETKPERHIKFGQGVIKLPTIYEVITMLTGIQDDPKEIPNGQTAEEKIKDAFNGLYNKDINITKVAQDNSVLDSDDASRTDLFIGRELEGKLYLMNEIPENGQVRPFNKDNLYEKMTGLQGNIAVSGINGLIDPKKMLNDTKTYELSKLSIYAKELAAIINSSVLLKEMDDKGLPYNNFSIAEGADIVDGKLIMTIIGTVVPTKVDPNNPPKEGEISIKNENMFPAQIQVTATIDTSEVITSANSKPMYNTTIKINQVPSMNVINDIIKGVMGDSKENNFSVDSIQTMIGEKIAESLSKFEAAGTKATFKDGKMTLMSVYDVVYDNVLKENLGKNEENVQPKDLPDIFRNMLVKPEKMSQGIDGKLDNIATELNKKMLLKDKTIDPNNLFINILPKDGGTNTGIFERLALQDRLWTNVGTVDTPNYAWTYNETSKMNIEFTETDMYRLMKQKMDEKLGESGSIKLPAIFDAKGGISFANLIIPSDGTIAIYIQAKKNAKPPAEFEQLAPFLPDTSEIHMQLTIADGVVSGNVKLFINKMPDDEVTYNKSVAIMKAMATGFDMNDVSTKVSGEINNVFKQFTDVGLPFAFTSGKATTGNIYDILKKSDAKLSGLANEEIHSALCGLFAPTEEQDKSVFNEKNANTVVPENLTWAITTDKMPPTKATASVEIVDTYIAYGLFTGNIKSTSGDGGAADIGETDGKIRQMMILTGNGLNKVKNQTSTLNKITGYDVDNKPITQANNVRQFSDIFKTDTALMVTITIKTAKYKGTVGVSTPTDTSKTSIGDILPDQLTITAVLDVTKASGATPGEVTAGNILINGMTKADMGTLKTMLGGQDITGEVRKTVENEVINQVILDGKSQNVPGLPDVQIDTPVMTIGKILSDANTTYEDLVDSSYNVLTPGQYGKLTYKITRPITLP